MLFLGKPRGRSIIISNATKRIRRNKLCNNNNNNSNSNNADLGESTGLVAHAIALQQTKEQILRLLLQLASVRNLTGFIHYSATQRASVHSSEESYARAFKFPQLDHSWTVVRTMLTIHRGTPC